MFNWNAVKPSLYLLFHDYGSSRVCGRDLDKNNIVWPPGPVYVELDVEVLVVADVASPREERDELREPVDGDPRRVVAEAHPFQLDGGHVDSFEELTGGPLVEDVDLTAFDVDLKDGLVGGHERKEVV